MSKRQPIKKKAPPAAASSAGGLHRLTNMVVEEVSTVDRAANMRRFLLVKRDGDMALQSDGRGGLTKIRKADAAGAAATDEETEKAKGKPFPGAAAPFKKPGEGDDKGKTDDEEKAKAKKAEDDAAAAAADDEEKKKRKAARKAELSATLGELTGCIEGMMGVAKALQDLEDGDDEPDDEEVGKSLSKAHDDLGKVIGKFKKAEAAPAAAATTPATPAAASAAASADVAKAGRKMSGARLAQFKDGMANLNALLAELLDDVADAAGANEDDEAEKTRKAELAKAVELAKAATDLAQRQAEEIRALKSATPGSNSLPVERATRTTKNDDDEVSWSLDMNRPNDRSSVDKSLSFHDP